ncbi:MAG TPA: hypothetical protein VM535_02190 [Candidatus Saccharimonadales bacterium]|nr:hypothetical protein [Candidatus Saccharimonadales bacterium]
MKRALKIIAITFIACAVLIGAVSAIVTEMQQHTERIHAQEKKEQETREEAAAKQRQEEAGKKSLMQQEMYKCITKAQNDSTAALNDPRLQEADPTFVANYTQNILLSTQNQIAVCKTLGSQ